MSSTPPSPKADEDPSSSQRNVTDPADCTQADEPKMPEPLERQDLYHYTFPRDVVPPLMAAVVLGTKPPLYFLGWRYKYREFRKRFDNGHYEDPSIIFRQKILPRFAEQSPEFENARPRSRPMIWVDRNVGHCTVIAGTNAFESAQNLARNDKFVEAVKKVLNEDREPVWYRHPPKEAFE
ncbi:uncharacterized protein SCHCODRAFT_02588869 [Schizophyllum commune H4-8]|nr:uncharacterized protein SCHCODRAFT_02588869 [Schizophyllum commune H4-8]KAI5887532.1 hypothetical protein SCHCODRAFT_02588869 [Schizophyllum commune H4-8]